MTEINQKEYLKRYLNIGNDDGKKKKRKKKAKVVQSTGLKIVDDDLDISHANTVEEAVTLLETNEDAPQIAGYVDERPFEARWKDYRDQEKWKPLNADQEEDEGNVQPNHFGSQSHEPVWGKVAKRNGSDSDNSPPRRGNKSPDVRKRRGSDNSPPRRRQGDTNKKQYDSDNSPPRSRNADLSPVRNRKRQQSDSDNSPPRSRQANRQKSPEPRHKRRRSPDSDNSPPRNRNAQKRRSPDSDHSPPRRRTERNDARNKDRRSRWGPAEDDSVSRSPSEASKRKRRDSDSSPPRRNKPETSTSTSFKYYQPRSDSDTSPPRRQPPPTESDKMKKTLDGKKAGLQDAKDLQKETALFRKREDEHFRSLPAEVSGVNAAPIMRDKKTGKIRDLKKEAADKAEKEKREAAHLEKYSKWGKGVKQVQDKEQKQAEEAYEMTKPLARYANDDDLERYLKEQEREGDPMLAYIRSKRKKQQQSSDTASGKPSKPQYDGEFMPNRYGIPPGHRWDGVDRSSGYEKRWFETQNSKKAVEEEIYKWSTEDM